MKTKIQTLDPMVLDSIIEVSEDRSDCIVIIDSNTTDLDSLVAALKAQAKHGVLGESLRWLFVDETKDGKALTMLEARDSKDWLEAYKAIYWFVSGWSDAEFYQCKP